jgi:hypothetical protein
MTALMSVMTNKRAISRTKDELAPTTTARIIARGTLMCGCGISSTICRSAFEVSKGESVTIPPKLSRDLRVRVRQFRSCKSRIAAGRG